MLLGSTEILRVTDSARSSQQSPYLGPQLPDTDGLFQVIVGTQLYRHDNIRFFCVTGDYYNAYLGMFSNHSDDVEATAVGEADIHNKKMVFMALNHLVKLLSAASNRCHQTLAGKAFPQLGRRQSVVLKNQDFSARCLQKYRLFRPTLRLHLTSFASQLKPKSAVGQVLQTWSVTSLTDIYQVAQK